MKSAILALALFAAPAAAQTITTTAKVSIGGWGHHEFTGQPLSEAPKRRAIERAVAGSVLGR